MKNSERLKYPENSEAASSLNLKRPRRSSRDKIGFSKDCLFCNKEGRIWRKIKGVSKNESCRGFEKGGGQTIQELAEKKGDEKLLTRIRGVCLYSAGAQYHPSCRKAYTRKVGIGRSGNADKCQNQSDLEETHKKVFEKVCAVIQEHVVVNKEIVKLADMRKYYTELLNDTIYPNPYYRANKLKSKLMKHEIGSKLSFTNFERDDNNNKYSPVLLFSNSVEKAEAINLMSWAEIEVSHM